MSELYGDRHRELQERFETRKMADRIEQSIVSNHLSDQGKAFIESRDMFFLSTVDHHGRPTVSYKGGDPGFIKVLDDRTIAFPNYDGNGMFFSMGNIAGNAEVGLLLMDFEHPLRMRIQGVAALGADDPLLAEYKEADLMVRVAVSQTWINCPRYIHKYRKEAPSRYVPRAACETPYAEWKRIDFLQDALAPKDRGKAESLGGTLTMEEWAAILPSEWYENAPMSVLEAYLLGKPVIGARIGGIPEIVRDGTTGWLFEPGSIDKLMDVMRSVQNMPDSEVAEVGRSARQFVETNFTPGRYLQDILSVYRSVGAPMEESIGAST